MASVVHSQFLWILLLSTSLLKLPPINYQLTFLANSYLFYWSFSLWRLLITVKRLWFVKNVLISQGCYERPAIELPVTKSQRLWFVERRSISLKEFFWRRSGDSHRFFATWAYKIWFYGNWLSSLTWKNLLYRPFFFFFSSNLASVGLLFSFSTRALGDLSKRRK